MFVLGSITDSILKMQQVAGEKIFTISVFGLKVFFNGGTEWVQARRLFYKAPLLRIGEA
jgi:hypothetical protein